MKCLTLREFLFGIVLTLNVEAILQTAVSRPRQLGVDTDTLLAEGLRRRPDAYVRSGAAPSTLTDIKKRQPAVDEAGS